MDWSDDVAYSVHDLEDALHAGHLVISALRSGPERAHLVALCQERYAVGEEAGAVEKALDRLLVEPWWPTSYDGSQRALAGLKNLTSQLIGRFCNAAEAATRARYGDRPLRRYEADLVVPDETRLECAVLKAVTAVYVMERAGAPEAYARQRDLVRELAAAVLLGAPGDPRPGVRARRSRSRRRRRPGSGWSSTRWPRSPTRRRPPGTRQLTQLT